MTGRPPSSRRTKYEARADRIYPTHKYCPVCEQDLPVDCFYPNYTGIGGRHSKCIKCTLTDAKMRRLNKESKNE